MSPVFGTIGLAPTGMRCAEGEQVHQATIYVRHLVEGDIPSRGPDKRANRVRREKVMVHSESQTRPGTGSFHPVAIRAAVEATRPLKPLVQKVV